MAVELFPNINPIEKDLIKISIERYFLNPQKVYNYIKTLKTEEEKEFAWLCCTKILLERGYLNEEDNPN